VRFYVRPEREPVKNAVRRHPVEVVRQAIEIDDGDWRLERRKLLRRFGGLERGERRAPLSRGSLH
jgi:hypothetical protein